MIPSKHNDDLKRRAAAIRLLLRGQKYYESDPKPLYALMQAKAYSDLGDYKTKNDILRIMLNHKPEEFKIDSREGDIYGLTHLPSHFKIHTTADTLKGTPLESETKEWLEPSTAVPPPQTFGKAAAITALLNSTLIDKLLNLC